MRFQAKLSSAGYWLPAVLLAVLQSACQQHQEATGVIVAENARFQFVTPAVLRMEYSRSKDFVDAPSAVVQRREWPRVPVQSSERDGWLVASSGTLTVRYRLHSGEFTATNLEVSWKDAGGKAHVWRPGDEDGLNLGGMPYSLDNVSAENLPAGHSDLKTPVNDVIPGIEVPLIPAKPGLLSRAGYAFIDDSHTPVWNSQRTWIEPRQATHTQDFYILTYGFDYQKALQQYAQLCGAVPLVPRSALGPMVTDFNFEYFPESAQSRTPAFQRYNEEYLEDEISRLRAEAIPFDTLILDFAWHNYGWDGGYDWSPLIPHPQEFSRWLHGRGVKLSLNDHPGYANTEESILSFSDSRAQSVLRALGGTPSAKPALDLDISKGWRFAPDPDDRGLSAHWFEGGKVGPQWKPIDIGTPWQEQGYSDLQSVGWYRISVRLPATLPAHLYLYLGEVGKNYRIFVNGQEATHSQVHWPQRLTYTDIRPYARPAKLNDIVLRVESGPSGGGLLLGPVALRDVEPPKRIYFDLSNQHQAEVFMRQLHEPLLRQGVDFWWVDGGSGAVDMPGLNKQLWTNKVYFDYMEQHLGRRGFILGRYGDWGSERYPAFFTGDTYSQWPVLAYEVAFTARGGNVLETYISHDIGGFHGAKIDFNLYARWIEFGTFSPILRMHSAHANPREGNVRMPWVYGDEGIRVMNKYFTLRTQLIPYLYSYAWRAHRDSIPLLRPLYLEYPQSEEAYRHSREYFFGDEMLVAPVVDPSGHQSIYLPPGRWVDFFNGKVHAGEATLEADYGVDETPVFVREGAIIPEQPVSQYSDEKPLDALILNIYGSGGGRFDLYEDDGTSVAYRKGEYAITTLTHTTEANGLERLTIEPTQGAFSGLVSSRSYELRIRTARRPSSASVDGRDAVVEWNEAQGTATVRLPPRNIRQKVEVTWRSG